MGNGVYLSRLKDGIDGYLWSFMIPSEEHPAHFGERPLTEVICLYLTSKIDNWSYVESDSKFCILPERVLRW